METAAARGISVKLEYTRPSKFLLQEGHEPVPSEIEKRGLKISRVNDVHGKYLGWDEDYLVISSFNWMATSVDARRSRGDEIGALIEGPGIRNILLGKLRQQSDKQNDQRLGSLDGSMPS
jgi:hypothetical protein